MEQDEFDELLAKAPTEALPKPDDEDAIEVPMGDTGEEEEPEAEEETEELEAEEEAEEDEDEEAPDPRLEKLEAFLAKYGGDVDKAFEASVNAQSKIGEQGQELGELRRMVEELAAQRQTPPPLPTVNSELQEAIVDNPQNVAVWAIQTENSPVYEMAMTEWYEQDAKAASRFERALEMQAFEQRTHAQVQPDIEKFREKTEADAVAAAHRSLAQRFPDFQEVLETATQDELAGIDRNLLAQAQKENPAQALELVYRWVRTERDMKAALKAERTKKVREAKKEAAVVTGENSQQEPEPTTLDKLKESMLAIDPWDVHRGLSG